MTCLDPTGQSSTKSRLLKLIFLTFFGISGTQLFALMFHFLRLISYVLLDTQKFPPKILPKQSSLFGMEIFQHDLNFNDNSSTVYTIQVVLSALFAIFTGGSGFMAICRERLVSMKIYSLIMLLITFVTGMGSFSSPNLVHLRHIVLPLLGGGVSSLVSFVYSLIVQQQRDTERIPTYQNYNPYNSAYNNPYNPYN